MSISNDTFLYITHLFHWDTHLLSCYKICYKLSDYIFLIKTVSIMTDGLSAMTHLICGLHCTVDYLILCSLEITFHHCCLPTDLEQIETETKIAPYAPEVHNQIATGLQRCGEGSSISFNGPQRSYHHRLHIYSKAPDSDSRKAAFAFWQIV